MGNAIKLVAIITIVFTMLSCNDGAEVLEIAPGEITNARVESGNTELDLFWDDPEWELDWGGGDWDNLIEITFTPKVASIEQPIYVEQWMEQLEIVGLTNEVSYIFSITAMTASGVRSGSKTIKGTPTEGVIFNPNLSYGEFTDIRDGKVYKSIKIGDQTWMAQNLAYEIPGKEVQDDDEWERVGSLGEKDAWCYNENDKVTYGKYGVLYQRNAALVACPGGWHLSTAEDWSELETYLKNNGYSSSESQDYEIAQAMAAHYGWKKSEMTGDVGRNPSVNNSSGFSALASGCRYDSGMFGRDIGIAVTWWTGSNFLLSGSSRSIGYGDSSLDRDPMDHLGSGNSVRCVKD